MFYHHCHSLSADPLFIKEGGVQVGKRSSGKVQEGEKTKVNIYVKIKGHLLLTYEDVSGVLIWSEK